MACSTKRGSAKDRLEPLDQSDISTFVHLRPPWEIYAFKVAENERDFQILLSVWLLNHQNGTENACKAMQHSTCQEKVFNEHQPNF